MNEIIDFRLAYMEKNGTPEQRVNYKDENGDSWFEYCYEYDFLDKKFGVHFWARNKDEAFKVCDAVRRTLRLMGEVIEETPA